MTRISDTQFRKLLLYPAELWAHRHAQIFRAKISYHEKVIVNYPENGCILSKHLYITYPLCMTSSCYDTVFHL